jgi:membrane dipeptidase
VPDDVLRLLSENGGVIQVNFVRAFISPENPAWQAKRKEALEALRARLDDEEAIEKEIAEWEKENPHPGGSIAEVADHIDHIREIAGIDHVGIGADFYDAGGTMAAGLNNVTRYPHLFAELLRREYSDEEVLKVAGRNLLRAMRRVERVAADLQKTEPPLVILKPDH